MPRIQKGARNGTGKTVCHRGKDTDDYEFEDEEYIVEAQVNDEQQ